MRKGIQRVRRDKKGSQINEVSISTRWPQAKVLLYMQSFACLSQLSFQIIFLTFQTENLNSWCTNSITDQSPGSFTSLHVGACSSEISLHFDSVEPCPTGTFVIHPHNHTIYETPFNLLQGINHAASDIQFPADVTFLGITFQEILSFKNCKISGW